MCLAIPGKLIEIIEDADPVMRRGRVDFNGAVKKVNLSCVPEAAVGDYVNVHVGFALNVVDEAAAAEVFDYLEQMEADLPGSGPEAGEDAP